MDLTRDKNGEPLLDEHTKEQAKERFLDMVQVMARLRAECPWDKKQTPESMKHYVLEEAYEVVAAIESGTQTGDWGSLREELGDHLLQVLFLAQIMTDEKRFTISDVLSDLAKKMVYRHPHVYGDIEADADQVVANWEVLKKREKTARGTVGDKDSLFADFQHHLPALLESYKIGKRAAKVGFDWPEPLTVLDKIEEEIREVREAVNTSEEHLAEELGDLLFAVSNVVRKFKLEPETCLRHANAKFVKRFKCMEELARTDGVDFAALDLDAQEEYWNRAKLALKQRAETE